MMWQEQRSLSWSAGVGQLIIVAYVLAAMVGPFLAPYGELEIVAGPLAPWGEDGLVLGTDFLGRDMLTRLLYGARNTVGIAALTTAVAFVIGTLATLSVSPDGALDRSLGFVVDAIVALPRLVIALVIVAWSGSSLVVLVATVGVLESFRVCRSVRELGSAIRSRAVSTLAAEFGQRFCFVLLLISTLGFLGVGVQPPHADWGNMARENGMLLFSDGITTLLPAGAIALLIIAVNCVVDWCHRRAELNEG